MRQLPRTLMGYAGRFLITASRCKLLLTVRFDQPRSDLSFHHLVIAFAIGGSRIPMLTPPVCCSTAVTRQPRQLARNRSGTCGTRCRASWRRRPLGAVWPPRLPDSQVSGLGRHPRRRQGVAIWQQPQAHRPRWLLSVVPCIRGQSGFDMGRKAGKSNERCSWPK